MVEVEDYEAVDWMHNTKLIATPEGFFEVILRPDGKIELVPIPPRQFWQRADSVGKEEPLW